MYFKLTLNQPLMRAACAALAAVFMAFAGSVAADETLERISVAYCADCVPFHFTDEQRQPAGMIIDQWRLWSEKTGIAVQFIEATWDETLRMVAEGRADAHAGLFFNEARDKFLDYGVALTRTGTQAFLHGNLPAIRKMNDLEAYRIGVVSGDFVESYLKEKVAGADIVGFPDYEAIMTALNEGRLRAFAADTPSALYHLKRHGLVGDYSLSNSQLLYQNDWFIAVGEGNATLLEIINRGMEKIGKIEKQEIDRRWGPDDTKIEEGGLLTAEERQWVRDHRGVRLGVDPAWPPFDYVDDKGFHLGFAADILRLLQQRLGASFELVPGLTWSQVLEGAEARTIDLISICAPTPERAKYLRFTQPMTAMPWVIVTRKDFRQIKNLSNLAKDRVSMTTGYAVVDLSRAKFTGLPIREVTSPLEGLKAVAVGESDAYVDNLGVVNHLIQKNALSNLRIAADSGLPHQHLKICVRSDWPELVAILNKGLDKLPSDEVRSILRKWIPVEIHGSVVSQQVGIPEAVWWLGAVVLAAFLGLVAASRILMRSASEESLALQFGSKRFRANVTIAVGFLILVVVFIGWLALLHNHGKVVGTVRTNLQTVLYTTAERLNDWVAYRKRFLAELGRETELARITEGLIKLPVGRNTLLTSASLAETRRFFERNQKRFGNLGFFIINADSISIAARRDTNIGTRNLIAEHRPDLIQRVLEGETVFVPPIRSDVALGNVGEGHMPPTMFFAAPIRKVDGTVIAALAQRVDPGRDFTRVLQFGGIGETGESYAFDRQGLLLSESRFDEDLRKAGIINPDQKSMLNVQIRDPGGNMMEGFRPQLPRSEMSPTRMADSAVQGESGIDMEGYRDYRGVPVFGAWIWDTDLGLGLATEIDMAEGLSSFYTMRLTAVSVLGVVLILTVGAILFTLTLGERANLALTKARNTLEERVTERTQELENSETRIRTIIDNAADGIIVISGNGIIQSFSPAAERIFGYTSSETVGKNVMMLMPEPMRSEHDGYLERHLKTSEARIVGTNREVVGLRKDGTEFPMDLAVGTARVGNETIFTGVIRDITERKQAEAVLAEKQAQLRSAMDNMPGGMLMVAADLKFVVVNDQYGKLFSFPDGLVSPGKSIAEMFRFQAERGDYGEGDVDELVTQMTDTFLSGDIRKYERLLPDGVTAEVYLEPTSDGGVIAIARDISDRKVAEADAARQREIIELTMENMDQGISMFDGKMNMVVHNAKFTELLEFPQDLLQRNPSLETLFRYNAERGEYGEGDVEEQVQTRLELAQICEPHHFERSRPDGTIIEVRGLPVPDGSFVTTYTDITERKRAEEQLASAFGIISGSIDYAARIQRSVLPDNTLFESLLRDYFVIWEPRDVVGGDIYWSKLWGDGLLIILGDCTGHGVPGAFMTLIATGALDHALSEVVHGQINALIQRLHQVVQITLGQHGEGGESDDGLELGVCYLDAEMTKVTFAGARFNLYLVEDGVVSTIKGTKSGVGYHGISHSQEYDEHEVVLLEGKSIYMTTDGLIDQVGGERGRGFGKRRFQALLTEIGGLPMAEQKKRIWQTLTEYQGEQNRRDDIAVVGFKV